MNSFGLLAYQDSGNLGDEIQSLAAAGFLPRVDYLINRDEIARVFLPTPTKIILNGWFCRNPHSWPIRDENIRPLFLSFHISNEAGSNAEALNRPECIAYYKKHGPIGCRDMHTLELLRSKGVDAYFSGCLTLTLKKNALLPAKREGIYFADVPNEVVRSAPLHIQRNARFVTHSYAPNGPERFDRARQLLAQYENAKLVITSRLHAALPCAAFGTPVFFVHSNPDDPRFGGLKELTHFMSPQTAMEVLGKIDWDNPPANPVPIDRIRNDLAARALGFVNAPF